MWFNINIDFTQIRKNNIDYWKKRLDEFATEVRDEVKLRTPEDTKNLVNSINKTEQIFTWSKILQQVKSTADLEYVWYVEYWVWSKEFNYHKPKWSVFLVDIWAGMFRRTYAKMKDKFKW